MCGALSPLRLPIHARARRIQLIELLFVFDIRSARPASDAVFAAEKKIVTKSAPARQSKYLNIHSEQ